MGWRRALITISATIRRQEREAARRARLAEQDLKRLRKDQARQLAIAEVAAFEGHIDSLTSMHRECMDPIDWEALLMHPLPPPPAEPPPIDRSLSQEARAALESHTRSVVGRLLGSKRRTALEQALEEAEEFELTAEQRTQADYQARVAEHLLAVNDVRDTREIAARVLAGDLEAQLEAVQISACLTEVATTLGQARIDISLNQHHATVVLHAEQETVVPTEQKSLTVTETVSRKKFAASRRMEIYEDYVCGAALRASREIMAAIPTPAVLVHVESMRVVPSTGHLASFVILSVLVPREVLDAVDWDRVDASELVSTLHRNMRLKRGMGFEPVEKLKLTET